jgi:hypothetical protein
MSALAKSKMDPPVDEVELLGANSKMLISTTQMVGKRECPQST